MTLQQDIKDRIENDIRNHVVYRKPCGGSGWRALWGGILIVVGTLILLDHFGIVNANAVWKYWPMLVIVIGLRKFFAHGQQAWGAFVIFLGVLLQLDALGVAHFQWVDIWPVLLIGAGIFMIWGSLEARIYLPRWGNSGGDPRTTLNEHVIFGGVEKRVNSKNFKGGQVDAVFGGIEIDLRDAEMEGDEAVLVANALFGGIEIRVPDTWFVASEGQGIFGGFTDSTHFHGVTDPSTPHRKTLIVKGSSIFGGVEIRN
jgi:predicted membrane protein